MGRAGQYTLGKVDSGNFWSCYCTPYVPNVLRIRKLQFIPKGNEGEGYMDGPFLVLPFARTKYSVRE